MRRKKRNRAHPADKIKTVRATRKLFESMSKGYKKEFIRANKSKIGRKALKGFKQFWSIPLPPQISLIPDGTKGRTYLAGMGTAPGLFVGKTANKRGKKWLKGDFNVAMDSKKKTIYWLPKKAKKVGKPRFKRDGFVIETHYIPTREMEDLGTKKARTYWIHKHHDDGGKPPEHWFDPVSGIHAAKGGTFKIDTWIRR